MYYTYILYSASSNKFYKGSTNDLESRLNRHNSGYEKFTSSGVPWTLVWFTTKPSRSEAMVGKKIKKPIKRQNYTVRYKIFLRGPGL